MGNRSKLFRWWDRIAARLQPLKHALSYLGRQVGEYGKPRYWLLYFVAFGLGFFLFGPPHGWQKLRRTLVLPDRAVVKPDPIMALQREVAILKKDLQKLKDRSAAAVPFTPERFGKPASGQVIQGFQWVLTGKVWRLHPGVEIKLPMGSEVMAAADGKVIGCEPTKDGYTITIDHGSGWKSVYAQLGQASVAKGIAVRKGQVIGISGISRCVTLRQPGFHFGIYQDGEPVDPQKIISGLK
ncbi:MAG TPA: M23 family metallopeptidase [Bacillota bacterium]